MRARALGGYSPWLTMMTRGQRAEIDGGGAQVGTHGFGSSTGRRQRIDAGWTVRTRWQSLITTAVQMIREASSSDSVNLETVNCDLYEFLVIAGA